uniref:Uncharacterized protein n=1 Tax=viral metagenome TaxID=1070528 RepID=A0A6M3XNM9_9ZZZZ
MKISTMFDDPTGKFSSTRFYSFLALLYFFFYVTYPMVKDKEPDFEMAVLIALMIFAPKLIGKFAERYMDRQKPA